MDLSQYEEAKMNEPTLTITLTEPVLRLILTLLRRSDPLGIYAAPVVADIERQAAAQAEKETANHEG
jgi:hypothetical protein